MSLFPRKMGSSADKRDTHTAAAEVGGGGEADVIVRSLAGDEVLRHLDALAGLRMQVFADWPYLYDGSLSYEAEYLREFAEEPGSVLIGAFAGERLVGAATASPLSGQKPEFRAPLEERGFAANTGFYFGESVLLPDFRGRGIGHAFFDQREAAARAAGARFTAFVAVDRPQNHPLRPADYWPLNGFWTKRGYAKQAGITARLRWKDHGETTDSEKTLTYWIRQLDEHDATLARETNSPA